jgi:hypothetical protein
LMSSTALTFCWSISIDQRCFVLLRGRIDQSTAVRGCEYHVGNNFGSLRSVMINSQSQFLGDFLLDFGVTGLPALVDLLPVMVASTGNVEMPRRILERMRHTERLAG